MQTPNKIIPASTQVGIPAFETDSYGAAEPLITSSKQITTGVEKVGANTNIPAHAVVARDGTTGVLILAVQGAAQKPVGITTHAIVTGAGVSTTTEVYKSGGFNPDALVWDASFDTAEEKARAFEGSLAPEIQMLATKFKPLV